MSVTLSQTRVRPDDQTYDVEMIGINYLTGRMVVRVRFASGDTQDLVYEGARLAALNGRVSQLNGLRGAVEADVAANQPGLEGTP